MLSRPVPLFLLVITAVTVAVIGVRAVPQDDTPLEARSVPLESGPDIRARPGQPGFVLVGPGPDGVRSGVRAFIGEHLREYALTRRLDLQEIDPAGRSGRTHRFEQRVAGLPVAGSRMIAIVDPGGRRMRVSALITPDPDDEPAPPAVSRADAAQAAGASARNGRAVAVRTSRGLRPGWQFGQAVVDALTGRLLRSR